MGFPLPELQLPLLFLLFFVGQLTADLAGDRAALQAFLSATPHLSRLKWAPSNSTCDWIGVTCDVNRSAVVELRLPGAGLVGPIPSSTLGRLSSLRVLSLRSNAFSGNLPRDFANLTLLRSLYLQSNNLSGGFPAELLNLPRLSRLDISSNNLSGEIPFGINNLTRLAKLYLQNNRLSGSLPSIDVSSLSEFDVSNNALNGSIPSSLSRFPASSFAGNRDLCGDPLPPCSPFFPSPAPSPNSESNPVQESSKKKLSTGAIIAIAVGGGVLLLLLLAILLCCLLSRRRKRRQGEEKPTKVTATAAATGGRSGETIGTASSSTSKEMGTSGGGVRGDEKNRLVFVGKGAGYSFDLEDLLRASAEVLGKGSVGTSYKAVLEDGRTVVVKRLKDVVVSKREFESQMEKLGSPEVEHPNVLPLRAYYFAKDEKLLVFDYLPAGSLSSLLHGSRASGRTPLDWDGRMRVALAAARGLAHIHSTAHLVHGNLKASNVLLRPDNSTSSISAAVTDYGLTPLFSPSAPLPSRVSGYRAPEFLETRRATYKSDVYSLGVLLLELLTGRSPNQATITGEEGVDLPRWVQSVVREEWTAEVFDADLARQPGIEEEMVQLLQVAMACVGPAPESRPDATEVARLVEHIAVGRAVVSSDEGRRTSTDDPSKGSSGGPTPPAGTTP